MPRKSGKQTPRERTFVDAVVSSGDAVYAAKQAGYAYPAQTAHHAMRNPALLAEIEQRQRARLVSEALPLALDRLIGLLQDAKTPGGVLVQAIKLTTDRAFGDQSAAKTGKDLSEMTPAELDEARAGLLDELARRAKPVIDVTATEPAKDIFG